MSIAARRTSALLLLAAVVAGLVLLLTDGDDDSPDRRDVTRGGTEIELPRSSQRPPRRRPQMPIDRALGQKIVARYAGARPTASLIRAVRAGRVGGVILFADNLATPSTARTAVGALQDAARAGGSPPLLVMTDQEGGEVKRAPWAPPRLSPAQMARASGPRGRAMREGAATGRALRGVGINVDLAPVADVPRGAGSFLGDRAFGSSPAAVASASCAFADGLRRGGVAPTFKHFPGLGRAGASTDLRAVRIPGSLADVNRELRPYRECARRVPLVMMSSASYAAIGTEPAVMTRSVYSELLPSVGFRGVTVTDAFDTPAVANLDAPARRSIQAGVDLLLYAATEQSAAYSYDRLLADVRAERLDPGAIRRSARRILRLKRRWTGYRPARAQARAPVALASVQVTSGR